MERLTIFDGEFWEHKNFPPVAEDTVDEFVDCVKELAERLASIEDILGDEYDLDHLRDLIQAEKDGRLVVLPWAVGETIYESDPEHGVVKHTLVDAAWCIHSKAEDRKGNAWYDFWDAADTAYKIREDAEEALASIDRKEGAANE